MDLPNLPTNLRPEDINETNLETYYNNIEEAVNDFSIQEIINFNRSQYHLKGNGNSLPVNNIKNGTIYLIQS